MLARSIGGATVRTVGVVLGAVALQGFVGCASSPPVRIPPGTVMIGEVMHALTAEQVAAGTMAPGMPKEPLRVALDARGLNDEDVRRGRVFVVRTMFYWNNTVSGIKHDVLSTEPAAEGLDVRPGNIVEMQVAERGALITRVRAANLVEGNCFYADVGVGTAVEVLGALSRVGPRGSASLYCRGLEHEGWMRPRTYWHKPPGPLQTAPKDAVPPRPVQPSAPATPTSSLTAQGLAHVTFHLSSSAKAGFLRDLPVLVDGERVASLEAGHCTVLLLAAGPHRVVAGRDGASYGFHQYARKALDLDVRAGDLKVIEYIVNDEVIDELSLDAFFMRDAWAQRAFTLRERAATPADSCALRGPVRVVGRGAPAQMAYWLTGPGETGDFRAQRVVALLRRDTAVRMRSQRLECHVSAISRQLSAN